MRNTYEDITVILPTLNEGKTIGRMLHYITAQYKGARVVVADDGSTDDTKRIAERFAMRRGAVRFFDRSAKHLRKGLTASVVDAILQSRTRFVVVLDADMQHPPGRIRNIVKNLRIGNDLVVATRARVTGWALYRKMISKALIHLGEFTLVVGRKEKCRDIFSGFFGVRRDVFIKVFNKNRHRFVGDGYKVLFDFLKCVDRGTLRIDEVPFVFRTRRFGSSKAGVRQGIAVLRSVLS